MKVRFFLRLFLIFSFFDMQQVFSMERTTRPMPISSMNAAYAKLAEAGCVPSMARLPESRSEQSASVHDPYSCIPSSAGRCNGACCLPAPRCAVVAKLELPQDAKEQEEAVQQLSDLLRKIVKTVGKSAAIIIAKTAIDESSDSDDTQSADSLNSPAGVEEDLLEGLRKK